MHVLGYIFHHNDEKITQKQLSEDFNVKHSTMAGILNRLKEKELIEIVVDEENRKYKNITLTKKAYDIQEQMDAHRNQTEAILMEGFSTEEEKAFRTYLDRIYYNLVNHSDIALEDMERLNKRFKKEKGDLK